MKSFLIASVLCAIASAGDVNFNSFQVKADNLCLVPTPLTNDWTFSTDCSLSFFGHTNFEDLGFTSGGNQLPQPWVEFKLINALTISTGRVASVSYAGTSTSSSTLDPARTKVPVSQLYCNNLSVANVNSPLSFRIDNSQVLQVKQKGKWYCAASTATGKFAFIGCDKVASIGGKFVRLVPNSRRIELIYQDLGANFGRFASPEFTLYLPSTRQFFSSKTTNLLTTTASDATFLSFVSENVVQNSLGYFALSETSGKGFIRMGGNYEKLQLTAFTPMDTALAWKLKPRGDGTFTIIGVTVYNQMSTNVAGQLTMNPFQKVGVSWVLLPRSSVEEAWHPIISPSRPFFRPEPGYCLDVAGWSMDNGAKMLMWDCHGGSNQMFRLDEKQRLVSLHSGKCVVVFGGQTQNGAGIIQWDCNDLDNQKWFYDDQGRLNARHAPGKCLDVLQNDLGKQQLNGAELVIWDCHQFANQQFAMPTSLSRHMFKASTTAFLTLKNKAIGDRDCVEVDPEDPNNPPADIFVDYEQYLKDIDAGGKRDGAQLRIRFCGADRNLFAFDDKSRLVAKHSGKCMDVCGGLTASGTCVIQWSCHDGNNQKWFFDSKGRVRSFNAPDKCLDYQTLPGQYSPTLIIKTCNESDAQKWLR